MKTPAERRLTQSQKKRLKTLCESGYKIRRVASLMGFRQIEIYHFANQLGFDPPWHWELAKTEFDMMNEEASEEGHG